MTRLIRFALSNFKYLLTLFSKFFSSFPHGTCSLSVSRQYLALDGAYHPFSAGVPTYTTLSNTSVRGRGFEPKTGLSPSLIRHSSRTQTQPTTLDGTLQITTRRSARNAGFQFELFPLHSPLLRESLLVSFPPLNDMLKFRGFSRLT